jgi:hypothetical protein
MPIIKAKRKVAPRARATTAALAAPGQEGVAPRLRDGTMTAGDRVALAMIADAARGPVVPVETGRARVTIAAPVANPTAMGRATKRVRPVKRRARRRHN